MQSSSRRILPSIFPYLNPIALVFDLWQYRDLILQFTVREIEGRYKGSSLGLFWSFAQPLLLLATYTLVFGVIFRSRWSGANPEDLRESALIIFCGLIAFNIFGECVNRAAGLIVEVPNYVKKVVFPLEVLPVSVLGSALFHALVSLTVLSAGVLLTRQRFSVTLTLLPIVILPLVFLSLGLTWFLAGLGVFLRDIRHLVSLAVQILFFMTPIFYSLDVVPQSLRPWIRINPLTSAVNNFRRVVLWGTTPEWAELTAWLLASGAVLLLGYAWFMKTKKGFADVI
ncbi:MAG: ABC transporter permease [Acidobacteria bacterium]|nr:ABC transporter permease [Acidobacteriota bacterium]